MCVQNRDYLRTCDSEKICRIAKKAARSIVLTKHKDGSRLVVDLDGQNDDVANILALFGRCRIHGNRVLTAAREFGRRRRSGQL